MYNVDQGGYYTEFPEIKHMKKTYSLSEVADMLSVSKETLRRWDNNGKLTAAREPMSNYRVYKKSQLKIFDELDFLFKKEKVSNVVKPAKKITSIELFAGAGGLAIGLEQAGIECLILNEIDKWAAATLRKNKPNWNVVEDDVRNVSFKKYKGMNVLVRSMTPCDFLN